MTNLPIFSDKSILKDSDSKALEKYYLDLTVFRLQYAEYINERRYRVADTTLSYRQINFLDNSKVLKEKRESKKEWRKFTFKELVYFSIVKELRNYGFKNNQLKRLYDIFFKKENRFISDFALMLVSTKENVILVIDEKHTNFYTAEAFLDYLKANHLVFMNVNLNEIYMNLNERLGKERIEYKTYLDLQAENITKIYNEYDLNKKEAAIIKIIRNKDYKNIKVRKSGDKDFIIKGEKTTTLEEKDLMEMIKNKEFADIQIVKRDGNIVNIKIEDTYKI